MTDKQSWITHLIFAIYGEQISNGEITITPMSDIKSSDEWGINVKGCNQDLNNDVLRVAHILAQEYNRSYVDAVNAERGEVVYQIANISGGYSEVSKFQYDTTRAMFKRILYTAPQPLKDHQIRELVNKLKDVAIQFHATQQLRAQISNTVIEALGCSYKEATVAPDQSSQSTLAVALEALAWCSGRMPNEPVIERAVKQVQARLENIAVTDQSAYIKRLEEALKLLKDATCISERADDFGQLQKWVNDVCTKAIKENSNG